jgi:hypothetical protein
LLNYIAMSFAQGKAHCRAGGMKKPGSAGLWQRW